MVAHIAHHFVVSGPTIYHGLRMRSGVCAECVWRGVSHPCQISAVPLRPSAQTVALSLWASANLRITPYTPRSPHAPYVRASVRCSGRIRAVDIPLKFLAMSARAASCDIP